MCDRRLQQAAVSFGTAEEYYNYGVALINARNLAEARTHLEKALAIAPGTDHIHYALALAQALSRRSRRAPTRTSGAPSNWSRATACIARQDADFAPLANQSAVPTRCSIPEKKSW